MLCAARQQTGTVSVFLRMGERLDDLEPEVISVTPLRSTSRTNTCLLRVSRSDRNVSQCPFSPACTGEDPVGQMVPARAHMESMREIGFFNDDPYGINERDSGGGLGSATMADFESRRIGLMACGGSRGASRAVLTVSSGG